MNSSAKHCQLAFFVNEVLCNACCPLAFNSRRLDEFLVSIIGIIYEKFSKRSGAYDGGVAPDFLRNSLQYGIK